MKWMTGQAGTRLVAAVCLLAMGGAAEQTPAGQAAGEFRIAIDLNLVVVHATVRDPRGGLVADLEERNFEVYDSGEKREIRYFQREDIPVTAGLIIDHSGSMGPKLREVALAATSFVEASNPKDEMFVVNFHEHALLGLPEGVAFTSSAPELGQAIWRMPTQGQTALYDAVVLGLHHVQRGNRDKKVLLVISDGADNASVRRLAEAVELAGKSDTVIYTIGIFDAADPDRNPGVLKRLARATGGAAYFPSRPGAITAVCQEIAREIRNQYMIGFLAAAEGSAGEFRPIEVVARSATGRKLRVRTRAGYITGSPAGQSPPGAGR